MNIGSAIIDDTHFRAAVLYFFLYSRSSSRFFAASSSLSCFCACRRIRAARSADSRASAVRNAAVDDGPSADAAAAVVVLEDVPDMRVDDADPGGGLFTALAALCDILPLVVVVVVVVAYPRPIDAQHFFGTATAKHRSAPLALRPQCSVHIRLSQCSNNRPFIRERNIMSLFR
ncbi:hypothetical protein ACHAPE_006092 [Trichoderma viride]